MRDVFPAGYILLLVKLVRFTVAREKMSPLIILYSYCFFFFCYSAYLHLLWNEKNIEINTIFHRHRESFETFSSSKPFYAKLLDVIEVYIIQRSKILVFVVLNFALNAKKKWPKSIIFRNLIRLLLVYKVPQNETCPSYFLYYIFTYRYFSNFNVVS